MSLRASRSLKSAKHTYISKRIGKAIADYDMISEGDKILIALSGGKDSLTLLHMLLARKSWAPVKYEITVGHIVSDYRCSSTLPLDSLQEITCRYGIDLKVKHIEILGNAKEKRPSCFWCAWNRRKALFEMADENGCNKVAMGHHLDDIVETNLLNLFFNGEISTMNPVQEMFKGKLYIIRPLVYVEEHVIRRFALEEGLLNKPMSCEGPADRNRKYVKEMLRSLGRINPDVKWNILNSTKRIKKEYLGINYGLSSQGRE